jgi:Rrf2 family protein
LSSAAISARRSIPVKFLEAILGELKRDGLVRGQRGRGGGYRLARRAADISFGAVVRLMQGPLGLLPCVSVSQYRRCPDCADNDTCELKRLFRAVRDSTSTILDGWTLADALQSTGTLPGFSTDMKPSRRPGAKKSSTRKREKN